MANTMVRLILFIYFVLYSATFFSQTDASFAAALADDNIVIQSAGDTPVDFNIEDYDDPTKTAFLMGYLLLFRSDDSLMDNVKRALSSNYYFFNSKNKKYVFFIPAQLYGTTTDVDAFLDGKFSDDLVANIDDWFKMDETIDAEITTINRQYKSLQDSSKIADALKKNADSLSRKIAGHEKNIHDIEEKMAKLGLSFTHASITKDMINDINVWDNLFLSKVPDYNKIKNKDIFIKVLEANLVNLRESGFKYYDKVNTSNPYLHSKLVDALNDINANESEALKKMGFPDGKLIIQSAARTPLNQLVQILNRPSVAAGMFSSGHGSGCAADLSNPDVVKSHAKELSKLLNKYGMSFIRNDNQRAADPNHIFLSAYLDNPYFSNELKLKLYSGYISSLYLAGNAQRDMTDKLTKEAAKVKKGINDYNDAIKQLKSQVSKLQDKNKELEEKEKQKNSEYSQKLAEKLAGEAEKKRRNGDRTSEREYHGSHSPDGGYWEKNTWKEFHNGNTGDHCYEHEMTNSLGEHTKERECFKEGKSIERP